MIISGVTLTGTRVVDASIITQNLAIWIDANDPASYPGSGTTITDLSGNGRTQNLSNAAAYTVLDGVKCWDCSSTYYIRAASTGPTLPTTGFTYITWARMIPSSASWRTLFRSSPDDHAILIEIGTNRLGMYDNGTNAFYPSGYNDVSGLADVWVQWAVTGDSSGQTFYINGQQVGTTVQTVAGNAHDYTGCIPSQPFGYVANMFLYTSKLTQEQIQQNYFALQDRFVQPNIVTSNLQLWYDPSSSASYPGTGTTVYNLESATLPGTMSNITYTDPYFAYNGSSSQINIADAAALEPGSGDWTMEAWVYLGTNTGSKVILGKFDPGGAAQDVSYSMRINGANAYAQMGDGSGAYVDSTGYTLPLNTWKQIVYVWKNVATNSLETYVNGVSIGSVSHTLPSILNTSSNLYIGSYNNGEYSQWMNGRIGVVRLYNAALTASEVLQNFTADRGTYGI